MTLFDEPINRRALAKIVHGMTGTKEHRAWKSMRKRCYCVTDKRYRYYGARGIRVCRRWQSFVLFLRDMRMAPSPQHSLDRKNVNGNYNPNNCRWATKQEQSENRRIVKLYQYRDERRALPYFARKCGIPIKTVEARLQEGWSVEQALSTAVGAKREGPKGHVDLEHRLKRLARNAVAAAVRRGDLVRPNCCEQLGCRSQEVQAHHYCGYCKSNRLKVRWLCRAHHGDVES